MSSPAIEFQNVDVRFRVPHESLSGIKEYAIRKAQGKVGYEVFWALRNVSFQIERGEIFGIVGRNGSGKSTTLKVIARVLHPTGGRVITRGRMAPLLELGGGFHFELTGRENIFLNGALLGYTRKEISQHLSEIIEFSELSEFIDAPIRTYSTGMVARLGFAVATFKRPDILLVDEVLSVGDNKFQRKCIERMVSYNAQGTTIVFVSHSMELVQSFCNKAVWLESGTAQIAGAVADVTTSYRTWQEKESGEPIILNASTNSIGGSGNLVAKVEPKIFRDVPVDHWAAESINYLFTNGYAAGYSDNTFRPDLIFTHLHLGFAAVTLAKDPPYAPPFATEQIFTDIPLNSPIANWIEQAYKNKLTIAQKGERFWPEQGATKAELAYVLCKAIYGPDFEPLSTIKLSDVPEGYWAEAFISFCIQENLIPFYDHSTMKFGPELPLSRAEAAVILANFAKKKKEIKG